MDNIKRLACSFPGCEEDVKAKGLCSRHYAQLRMFGAPRRTARDRNEIIVKGEIAEIVLYKNIREKSQKAIIDASDVRLIEKYKWRFFRGYVQGKKDGKDCYLHRIIMNGCPEVDHINRDRLDNRRCNLRRVIHGENMLNQGIRKDNKTGYKGVRIRGEKFFARIRRLGKYYYLGTFDTPEEAAIAYNEAAQKYHGEFAFLNNVPDSSQGQAQQ